MVWHKFELKITRHIVGEVENDLSWLVWVLYTFESLFFRIVVVIIIEHYIINSSSLFYPGNMSIENNRDILLDQKN